MLCSPNWEKCAAVEGDVTTGKVPNLIEGNQYEFRVRAVNKAGPGEPSDATKPHIARPKKSKYSVSNCEVYRDKNIKKTLVNKKLVI